MIRLDLFFRQDRFHTEILNFFVQMKHIVEKRTFSFTASYAMHQDVSSLYSCKMTKFMQKLGSLDCLQGF